jgi:hypothetical protein
MLHERRRRLCTLFHHRDRWRRMPPRRGAMAFTHFDQVKGDNLQNSRVTSPAMTCTNLRLWPHDARRSAVLTLPHYVEFAA